MIAKSSEFQIADHSQREKFCGVALIKNGGKENPKHMLTTGLSFCLLKAPKIAVCSLSALCAFCIHFVDFCSIAAAAVVIKLKILDYHHLSLCCKVQIDGTLGETAT